MKALFLFLSLILLPTSLMAESFSKVVGKALQLDSRVIALSSEILAAESEVKKARASYFPKLNLTGSTGESSSEDELTRDGERRVWGLNLTQTIPIFGLERAGVRLAQSQLDTKKAEIHQLQQLILSEILDAKIYLHTRKEILNLYTALSSSLLDKSNELMKKLDARLIKKTDYLLVKIELARNQTFVRGAEVAYLNATANLEKLIRNNYDIKNSPPGIDSIFHGELPTSLQELLNHLNLAPSFLVAQSREYEAQYAYELAKAQRWPTPSLAINLQRGTYGTASANEDSIFLGFDSPIFSGGELKHHLRSLEFQLLAARADLENERVNLHVQLNHLWTSYQLALQVSTEWEQSEMLHAELVDSIQRQLSGGVATILDLYEARNSLNETKIELIEQRYARESTKIKLFQAIGGLKAP